MFSQAVIEAIGYYVYLLIDPANNEIFYIGKGTGNRIFHHIQMAVQDDEMSAKLDRIREIQARGDDVQDMIHRHGLTENEAFEVEAALIDLAKWLGIKLTNIVNGHHSSDRGRMTAQEVIAQYDAPVLDIQEPVMLVILNRNYQRGMTADQLYEITQGNWVVGTRRNQVQYVLAVYDGLVREVYSAQSWLPVKDKKAKTSKRWRFTGTIATELQHYVGGSVAHYITQGSQNPVRYLNC